MSVNITSLKEYMSWLEKKDYHWYPVKQIWLDDNEKVIDQKDIIHEYLRSKIE